MEGVEAFLNSTIFYFFGSIFKRKSFQWTVISLFFNAEIKSSYRFDLLCRLERYFSCNKPQNQNL